MKVGFVSLGCSKNLVDTEKTIGIFKANNYEIVNNPKEAEVIVINTCGFIEPAKEEAINTILEMAEYKKKKCKYLIVMGCLVERYKDELAKAIPEVDLWIKYSEYDSLWEKIEDLLSESSNSNKDNSNYRKNSSVESKNNNVKNENSRNADKNLKNIQTEENETANKYNDFWNVEERVISTGENFAYLKIADGCSNRCTYCAIPYIRGSQKSRKMEDIIKEANKLVSQGYKELILIAQDTTKYGVDIYGKPRLAELLQELCKIEKLHWIRFLYAYPETIDEELIKVVKENEKICKYFDIPIQHISDSILKKMNRKTSKKQITELLEKIRTQIPEVTLRTSLIVGFPGETNDDFKELQEFVSQAKFDKLGAFMYSKEEGTPAEKLPNQIHRNTKKSRYNKIMQEQQKISKQNLENKIGKTYDVLIEEISFDKKFLIGRTMQDVPEIDGLVYVKVQENDLTVEQKIGQIIKCKITKVSNYDLIGI